MKITHLAEVLIWSVVAYMLATNSETIIILTLGVLYGDLAQVPAAVLQNLIYVSPVFPLILGLMAAMRLKLNGEKIWAGTGLFAKTLPGDAVLGACAGVACIGVAVISLQIASRYMDVPAMHMMPPQVHIYFMTIGAIVPGFCEELYFRGMMLKVGSSLPKIVIIVLSALAFSAWHVGTPAYLPHTFLLGLMFGILTSVSGRLAPSIIAHTMANAGMGVLFLQGFKIVG